MNVNLPLPLLGGLSPAQFMRTHWQKKPLLIRGAVPDFKPLLTEKALLKLAARQGVQSRFVSKAKSWQLAQGPFEALPTEGAKHWSLLVQGVDMHHSAVAKLLQQFRFVPDARLDDVMISLASELGGVGPHFDSYDVFLLQAAGRRRWQISAQKDLSLVEGAPLKILQNFAPAQEYVLEPGDMLYLPPRYAHDGVALDEGCQTYSIGFRAPGVGELARELLQRLADEIGDAIDYEEELQKLYADKNQEATAEPAEFPKALREFALKALARAVQDTTLNTQLLGEYMSEPSRQANFKPRKLPAPLKAIALHEATKMSYDSEHIFINGESFACAGTDMKLMRKLANTRSLDAADLKAGSSQFTAALGEFAKEGWLHGE
jgi:50S ribosomal protein L16 3-hydroxylase